MKYIAAVILLVCLVAPSFAMVAPDDLNGVWEINIPEYRATGTATITGMHGVATVTSTMMLLPVTITKEFDITYLGDHRYQLSCDYGTYVVRYMTDDEYINDSENDETVKPYAKKDL